MGHLIAYCCISYSTARVFTFIFILPDGFLHNLYNYIWYIWYLHDHAWHEIYELLSTAELQFLLLPSQIVKITAKISYTHIVYI